MFYKIILSAAVLILLNTSCTTLNVKSNSPFDGNAAYIIGKWDRIDQRTKENIPWTGYGKTGMCNLYLNAAVPYYFKIESKVDFFVLRVPKNQMSEGYGPKKYFFVIMCRAGNVIMNNTSVFRFQEDLTPGFIGLMPIVTFEFGGVEATKAIPHTDKNEYKKLIEDFHRLYPDFKNKKIVFLNKM